MKYSASMLFETVKRLICEAHEVCEDCPLCEDISRHDIICYRLSDIISNIKKEEELEGE